MQLFYQRVFSPVKIVEPRDFLEKRLSFVKDNAYYGLNSAIPKHVIKPLSYSISTENLLPRLQEVKL